MGGGCVSIDDTDRQFFLYILHSSRDVVTFDNIEHQMCVCVCVYMRPGRLIGARLSAQLPVYFDFFFFDYLCEFCFDGSF